MTAPEVDDPSAPPPVRVRSLLARLARFAVWSLVALLLAGAGLVFVATRTVTLQWAAERVPAWTGGRLSIDGVTGSVFDGIAAESVRWQDGALGVTVLEPRLVLDPMALVDGFIRIERASAASVEVALPALALPAVAQSGRPRVAIRLPAQWPPLPTAAIERLDAGRVVVRRDGVEQFRLHDLEARFRAEGERLSVSVTNLDLLVGGTRVALNGDGAVLAKPPYATDSRIRLQVPVGASSPPLQVDVRANGPLGELAVRATTRWTGASVEARTVVHALDPRPLRQVRLEVRDLDLSLIDAAMPVTRLTGRYDAEISPAWATERRPLLIGPMTVTNAIPGPLDRKRLPAATAKAVVSYVGNRVVVQSLQSDGPLGELLGEGWVGGGGFRVVASSEALNLAALDSRLAPRTLKLRLALEPVAEGAGLDVDLKAADAALDAELLGRLVGDQLRVSRARVRLEPGRSPAAGQATFSGSVGTAAPHALALVGDFRDFDPARVLAVSPGLLNGRWALEGTVAQRLEAEVSLSKSRFRELPLAGTLAGTVQLERFQPQRIGGARVSLRWGATKIEADGSLGGPADALRVDVDAQKLAELQPGAGGSVAVRSTWRGALLQPSVEGTATGRGLTLGFGDWRAAAETATVQLTAARVASGALQLQARLTGVDLSPVRPQAAPLRSAAVAPSARRLRPADPPRVRLAEFTARIDGSMDRHRLEIDARGSGQALRVRADGRISDDGGWTAEVGQFAVSHPLLKMSPPGAAPVVADLTALQPFPLTASADGVAIRNARFGFNGATLDLRLFDWMAPSLAVRAEASGIAARWIGRFVDVAALYGGADGGPVDLVAARQDLTLAATLAFNGTPSDVGAGDWTGAIRLRRERGDLALMPPTPVIAEDPFGRDARAGEPGAGLRRFDLDLSVASRVVRVGVDIDGERIGRIVGTARSILSYTGAPVWAAASLARSPLDGQLDLAMPSFRWISPLIGDNWQVDGALSARLALAGTLTAPRADGVVTGSDLTAQEQTLGMRLRNGVLAAEFTGERVNVRVLRFESGDGSVSVSGLLQPPDSGRSEARIVVDRLPIPLGVGQRVILSGSTMAALDRRTLSVAGRLVADEGVIELKGGDAPSVSSDVVIVEADGRERPVRDAPGNGGATLRKTAAAPAARVGPRADKPPGGSADLAAPRRDGAFRIASDLEIDLGRRFRVFGSGLEAKLQGAIRLTGSVPESPRATGTVEIVDGTYQIYGRKLKIKRGRVIFNGPLDDPTLDIVAIREYLKVEPGVEISGTAVSPVVKLISEPEVAEAEKLSWLVLGTGLSDAQGGGQLLALQAAATTLFGDEDSKYSGGLVDRLGIDVLSVREQSSAPLTAAGGGDASQGAVVTIGKRLSSRLFVTYEQSLRGVWNILKLQYEITNRLSLSVQAGSDSAVDLLWFFPFD